jgi:predicted porin
MIGGLLKSASSTALFAALGLIALGAGVPAAKAADLGGDCCADLEERVAELEATTARKGNRKVSLTVSGQVTTAVMAWDAGSSSNPLGLGGVGQLQGSDTYVVDWTPAGGTFVSFTGSAKVSPSLTAGFQVVIAVASGSRSHQVNQVNDDQGGVPANGDTEIAMTLSNWYIDHKSLGRLTVGRINTATAGLSTIDLGGAGVAANASIGYWGRGFAATGSLLGVIDVNSAVGGWSHLLGGNAVNGASLSRANAVMYTSPTIGGFSVSASWGEDDQWDAALRYAGEFSGFRVAAGLGYRYNYGGLGEVTKDNPGVAGPEPEQVIVSGSVLHVSSGLFVTGSYINQDNDTVGREDTTLWYAQAGISKNWTGLGKTVIYGEYARVEGGAENFSNNGLLVGAGASGVPAISTTAEIWGLGIVQHIDAAAMELFLSYRKHTAEFDDIPSALLSINDFDVVVGGARIRF